MSIRAILATVCFLSAALAGNFVAGVETTTAQPTVTSSLDQVGLQAPYEILQPDASWCGPRVLYFFSIYLDKPCRLDDVVKRCSADEKGLTSLADLSSAADSLGLVPTAVRCNVDDLAEFNGPAIVSLSQRQQGPVHFVGLVRREKDSFVILDPSVSVRTYRISRAFLEESFTGHAILLGEAGRSRARWLPTSGMVALSVCWALIVGGVLWPALPARLLHAYRNSQMRGEP
ncbi:MAG: cysteine peptidase family C39 domain-containing protein [Planctomycetaceae bacterium]